MNSNDEYTRLMSSEEIEAIGQSDSPITTWGDMPADFKIEFLGRFCLGFAIVFGGGYFVLKWLGV